MTRRSILCPALAALALATAPATAAPLPQDLPPEPSLEFLERPDTEGTPTRVGIGVYLIDLYEIDDVDQTFNADFILSVTWQDPRLAVGMDEESGDLRSYDVTQVWSPEPMLLNSRGAEVDGPELVRVHSDGECTFSRRHTGRFSFKSDLSEFPLDRQRLQIGVVVPPRVGEVVLEHDDESSGIWEDVSVPNWELQDLAGRTYVRYLPQMRTQVHVFELGLWVERHHAYYVWKLIVPLIIVVLMSWAVFWISPKTALQLGLGATGVLTLIAYRFATATLLPPIGYLTRLDMFLTGASVLVLLALVEALVTVGLGDKGHVETALKVDRACRVAFPAALVGIIAWSFWL